MPKSLKVKEVDIPGYEGLYTIDRQGRVFSKRRSTFLKPCKRNNYFIVVLRKNDNLLKKRLHRLIAICFIPNPLNLPIVDHKNRNVVDNRIENLRWCNQSQNLLNRVKSKGTSSKYKGVHHNAAMKTKKWIAHAFFEGKFYKLGSHESENEAGEAYNKFAKENYGEFALLNKIQ